MSMLYIDTYIHTYIHMYININQILGAEKGSVPILLPRRSTRRKDDLLDNTAAVYGIVGCVLELGRLRSGMGYIIIL